MDTPPTLFATLPTMRNASAFRVEVANHRSEFLSRVQGEGSRNAQAAQNVPDHLVRDTASHNQRGVAPLPARATRGLPRIYLPAAFNLPRTTRFVDKSSASMAIGLSAANAVVSATLPAQSLIAAATVAALFGIAQTDAPAKYKIMIGVAVFLGGPFVPLELACGLYFLVTTARLVMHLQNMALPEVRHSATPPSSAIRLDEAVAATLCSSWVTNLFFIGVHTDVGPVAAMALAVAVGGGYVLSTRFEPRHLGLVHGFAAGGF